MGWLVEQLLFDPFNQRLGQFPSRQKREEYDVSLGNGIRRDLAHFGMPKGLKPPPGD